MSTADWIGLVTLFFAAVGLLGGWMQALHSFRKKSFDEFQRANEGRHDRTDDDIRALQTQMHTLATDMSRSYVQREDFRDAIDSIAKRFENAVQELGRRIDGVMRDFLPKGGS